MKDLQENPNLGALRIEAEDSGGGFVLVEHGLGPRVLAAPLHLHTREDEYSYVIEGRAGRCWERRRSSLRRVI